jgi:tight adherence protein B
MTEPLLGGSAVASALAAFAVLAWPRPGHALERLAMPRRPREDRWRFRLDRVWLHRPGDSRRPSLEEDLVRVLEGVAGALRAGLTPARALEVVASVPIAQTGTQPIEGLVARLAAVAATGARLEPSWRRLAGELHSPAIGAVAEAWALTERHGAPVVDVLDALTGALRDQRRAAAAVETALAAPRATASLLTLLPVGGLLLGELVGVHPVAVLLGTWPGRTAGVAGLICTLAGRLWMRRLVSSAVAI